MEKCHKTKRGYNFRVLTSQFVIVVIVLFVRVLGYSQIVRIAKGYNKNRMDTCSSMMIAKVSPYSRKLTAVYFVFIDMWLIINHEQKCVLYPRGLQPMFRGTRGYSGTLIGVPQEIYIFIL